MKPPRNKFKARAEVVDGHRFASGKEARRWSELRLLERAGEISELRRQVPILLVGFEGRPLLTPTGRKMRLTVDFAYRDRSGAEVLEDVKGVRTRDFDVRLSVAEAMGLTIRLT